MKIDRLLGIVTYLLNHKIATAQTLAHRFEVSKRTIQRDIDTLCLSGIPIISQHGTSGGYSISENFSLDRQIYNKEDFQNIILGLKGLYSANIKGKSGTTLEKVLSSSVSPLKQSVTLDFGALQEGSDFKRIFYLLEDAISKETVVEIDYSSADGRESTRFIEPLLLSYKWYSWYLFAYCKKSRDYRLFKLSRIKRTERKNMPFSMEHVNAPHILEEYIKKDTRKYLRIKLYCAPGIRQQVLEYLCGSISQELENGYFIYEMYMPENERMWFSVVMGFGSHVAVIEPDEVKKKLLDTAKEIINKYNL